MKKILFISTLFFCVSGYAQSKASLEKFWNTFRPLLIKKNFTVLANHVKFPLSSTGVLDGLKVLKISKAGFSKAMTNFLNLDDVNETDEAGNIVTNKYLTIYDRLIMLNDERKVSLYGKNARIHDLEFTFTSGKWMLVNIYDGRTE